MNNEDLEIRRSSKIGIILIVVLTIIFAIGVTVYFLLNKDTINKKDEVTTTTTAIQVDPEYSNVDDYSFEKEFKELYSKVELIEDIDGNYSYVNTSTSDEVEIEYNEYIYANKNYIFKLTGNLIVDDTDSYVNGEMRVNNLFIKRIEGVTNIDIEFINNYLIIHLYYPGGNAMNDTIIYDMYKKEIIDEFKNVDNSIYKKDIRNEFKNVMIENKNIFAYANIKGLKIYYVGEDCELSDEHRVIIGKYINSDKNSVEIEYTKITEDIPVGETQCN